MRHLPIIFKKHLRRISCLMLGNNLVRYSICSPNCHSFAYFLTFKSIICFLWHAVSLDWHYWWAMGGIRCCQTDSFWQLSTVGHVHFPRPMEGRGRYRGRWGNSRSSFSFWDDSLCASLNMDFFCLHLIPVFALVSISVCECVDMWLLSEPRHQSPIIPISYLCLALLPNLPDLPQINLSAVIKSDLILSPTFSLTYTRRLADTLLQAQAHTPVSTFDAGFFLPCGLLRQRRTLQDCCLTLACFPVSKYILCLYIDFEVKLHL